MPQIQLPVYPQGVEHLSAELAVKQEGEQVVYFNGQMPLFSHAASDVRSFRMITAQFCVSGNVKQSDIIRVFGVSAITVKRAVKTYRVLGPAGFFKERPKRGGTVLTPEVLAEAQRSLNAGSTLADISAELKVKPDTLKKAVSNGRLKKSIQKLARTMP